jgi:apolipoprotein D and lipocalin family protein
MPGGARETARARAAARTLCAALGLWTCLALGTGCRGTPPPQTVPSVDLERYLGTWYEIASFPAFFQRGCAGTTATYSRRDDGRIRVVNACLEGSLTGRRREVEGVAWAVGGSGGARLHVRFFWPFRGDYWILAVEPDYRWAVVGTPSRDYLWLLAREPRIPESQYLEMVERARAQGFHVGRLQRTPQPSP